MKFTWKSWRLCEIWLSLISHLINHASIIQFLYLMLRCSWHCNLRNNSGHHSIDLWMSESTKLTECSVLWRWASLWWEGKTCSSAREVSFLNQNTLVFLWAEKQYTNTAVLHLVFKYGSVSCYFLTFICVSIMFPTRNDFFLIGRKHFQQFSRLHNGL